VDAVDGILGTTWSRRRFVQLIGATAGAAAATGLLAACGGDDDDDDDGVTTGGDAPTATAAGGATPAAATATTGEAAATGGELRVAALQDNYRTEPNRANIGMSPLNTNIFDKLVNLTPDYQIEPMLAEAWEFVEPNTWRFTLRKDVTFHDGTPFTAEAVKWSMGRVAAASVGNLGLDENSTVIVDDHTVDITPARTNLRLVQQICHPSFGIVAPNTEPAEQRIGTGLFKEVEYLKEDRYVVEANPDYWGEKPLLDGITFRFMPDPTTRMLALQADEVDLIYDVPRESTAEVTSNSELRLATSLVGAYEALYVNIHGQEPYDLGQDKAVRQALAYAIDKQSIVDGVWHGNAEISNTMIPPRILGSAVDLVKGTEFDPEQAKLILEDAGWTEGSDGIREKNGRRLQLSMVVGYPNAEIHRPMPEFVQAQFADVGIALEIVQTPDTATYEARLQAGEGDLWAENGNQNDGNPCFLPDLLFYSPQPGEDAVSNMYPNAFAIGAAFDTHIDDCRAAVTTEEVQVAAANAMKVLIDDEFVVIPLAGVFRIYGLSANVEGFAPHPSAVNQRWTGISLKG
jgi:peptide/nickel transport system substrate-binding protein